MTTPSEITAKFVEVYKAFIVIEGKPTDSDVNWVFKALSRILYPIEYNKTDAVHNLIGIIQDDETHTTKNGTSSLRPKRPKIFDKTINGSLPVTIATQQKEEEHASLRTDWAVYNTAERKSGLFILKVLGNVWLSGLPKGLLTYFSDVPTKTMLDKLQEICLGHHKINILSLQENMRKMHNKCDAILSYIEALEDAQQKSKRTKMPINDATLVMYATRSMLST